MRLPMFLRSSLFCALWSCRRISALLMPVALLCIASGIAQATVTAHIDPASPSMCTSGSQTFTAVVDGTTNCEGTQGATTYKWMWYDTVNHTYQDIPGATSSTYNYTAPATVPSPQPVLACLVTVANCGSVTASTGITVKGPGISTPTITYDPNPAITCDTVHLTAHSDEVCHSGSITYTWDLGETNPATGTHYTATGETVTHQFAAGTYTVSVTATDGTYTSSASQSITIGSGTPGTPWNVTIVGSTSTTISLTWTGGGGASSYNIYRSTNGGAYQKVGNSGSASYTDTGLASSTNYCYYVTAVNSCGVESGPSTPPACGSTQTCTSGTVTIQSANATPNATLVGRTVSFDAAATTDCPSAPVTYSWDFGDGTTGTGASATHAYSAANADASGNIIPYTVTLTVSSGANSKTRTLSVTVFAGLGRRPYPGLPFGFPAGGADGFGDGSGGGGGNPGEAPNSPPFPQPPVAPHYYHCEKKCTPGLGALGASTVCTDTFSGNSRIWRRDPVATRGYPISVNVTLNTEGVDTNRPMGNAAHSYDIYVSQVSVYNGNCVATQHWLVVDGDGTRLDFGVASADPVATQSVFSALKVVKNGSGVVTGYQLLHAGPPESIKGYGNFTYTFDSVGKLIQLTDAHGNAQNVSYNAQNSPLAITDVSTGKHVDFTYWPSGMVKTIELNGSGVINQFTYTPSNKLTQSEVIQGGTTISSSAVGYNSDNTIASMGSTDAGSKTLTFAYKVYPSADCLTATVLVGSGASWPGTSGVIQTGTTPPAGVADVVKVTNSQGGVITCYYNAALDMIKMILPTPIGSTATPTVQYVYNSDHEVIQVTDTKSKVNFTYNASGTIQNPGTGYMTGMKDNQNYNWAWGWGDPNDSVHPTSPANLVSSQDPVQLAAGIKDTVVYGDSAQPNVATQMTPAGGGTWTFDHNIYGQTTKVTPPVGSTTAPAQFGYDETAGSTSLGMPKSATDGNGDLATIDSYDLLGDVLQYSTYPVHGNQAIRNTTQIDWDAAQKPIKFTRPDGKYVQIGYTGEHVTTVTGVDNSQLTFQYCADCGAMTGISGPMGASINWTYDGDHNLLSLTDARSKVTSYTYGLAEELQQVTYPDGTTNTFKYNPANQLYQIQNGRTHAITIGYDSNEAPNKLIFTRTLEPEIDVYTNPDRSLNHVVDAAGTTTYAYFPNGNVQSVIYDYTASGLTNLQELDYTYWPDGLAKTVTWKNGAATVGAWTYNYDLGGRCTSVVNPWSETTSWNYDGEGKLTAQTNANGTSTAVVYNQALGWPTSITSSKGATAFASYALTYDNGANTGGHITGVNENSGASTTSYVFDPLYRLTSATRTGGSNAYNYGYGYDLAGNRTSFATGGTTTGTLVYDDANKLSTYNGYAMQYDADGNWINNGKLATSFTLTYNDLNQLTHTHNLTDGTTTDPDMDFKYNAGGLRVMSQPAGGAKTFYIFAGGTLLGEVQGTAGNPATAAYTWGANGLISERLIASNQSLWYHFGPQGETRYLTNSAGNIADSYLYTPLGAPIASTGTDVNPFRFGGQFGYYKHPASQFSPYLCGARWYSSSYGYFLTRDPAGFGGGINLYQYCGGDPVNYVDPNGAEPALVRWFAYTGTNGFDVIGTGCNVMGGWGSVLSDGITDDITDWLGNGNYVDRCSTAYTIGMGIGLVHQLAMGKAGGAGRACGCLCFAPGTLVHMADGTTKPIEQVRPGEWVQCRNELTGQDSVKPVDSIINRHSDDIVKLQIADGSGQVVETITCTPDHPFYVPGQGFVAAGSLTAGTSLVSRSGSSVSVSDVAWEKADGGYTVYNFSVEADHSYFVGQEAGGVWVHNNCYTTLYRAVARAEAEELALTGTFRGGGLAQMTGKFFAESAEHAAEWGRRFYKDDKFYIVAIRLRTSAAGKFMRWDRLDGIGPARYADVDELIKAGIREISFSTHL